MAIKVQANTTLASSVLAATYSSRCVAKAPDGKIWVLYVNVGGTATWDLYVAYSSDGGATWTEELALENGRPKIVTAVLCLVVDGSSVPHIFYEYDPSVGSDHEVRVVSRTGGTWQAPETVSALSNSNILGLAACIDSSGNFHIAYHDNTLNVVRYVTGIVGSWGAAETAINANYKNVDIACSSADEPYIVCGRSGIYMAYKSGTWQAAEKVDAIGESGFDPHLVIDSTDDIHVVWRDAVTDDEIFYRKRESAVWQTRIEVVTSVLDSWATPLISMDTADNVYVIYQFAGGTTIDENVYFKKITGTSLSGAVTLDSSITQPDGKPSVFCSLWHKYPTSGVLSYGPVVILLDETGIGADVYFETAELSGEQAGQYAVVETRWHYFDGFGQERYILGTRV